MQLSEADEMTLTYFTETLKNIIHMYSPRNMIVKIILE